VKVTISLVWLAVLYLKLNLTRRSSELETLLPGLNQLTSLSESSSAIAKIADMEAVNNVFNKLGLDSSMVSQFAPLVLQYLTSQGASSDLLGSLSSLWQ